MANPKHKEASDGSLRSAEESDEICAPIEEGKR
jgi:hypothetical protein